MPNRPAIEEAVARGMAYLGRHQETDGSFVSYSSASDSRFRSLHTWHTTFVPALILGALAAVPTLAARRIRKPLAGFLLKQQGKNGTFNYWAKTAEEYRTMPYPDDLDDTFCSLVGFYLHDPKLIDEAVTAQIVKLLLATEIAVGGPYRTWVVQPESDQVWLDVDVAVNANVAYFLSLIGSRLPKLDELLERTVTSGKFVSPYYPSVYPFLYYFGRVYQGAHRKALLARIRQEQRDPALAPLNQALCISAGLRLGDTHYSLPAVTAQLLTAQRRDGSWPAAAFYADPLKKGRRYYNGGAALTTAFVCEALQLCLVSTPPSPRGISKHTPRSMPPTFMSRILALTERQCQTLPSDLRRTTIKQLAKIAGSSSGPEILTLPQRFQASLNPLTDTRLPASFLEKLSLANLYGWAAYTIYDDLLDDNGQPGLLPAANAVMRRSVACFSEALPHHEPFQALLRQTFDTIDGANAWEAAHCRWPRQGDSIVIKKLPDYGDLTPLADRSYGHALPVLAVALATGVDAESTDFAELQRALRHYLIARQLNDDAHDWAIDLENGHASYVVTKLLSEGLAVPPGSFQLPALLHTARKQFWHVTLPAVCAELRRHTDIAQQALERVSILQPDNAIRQLLEVIEASVVETLAQHHQARQFLHYYGEGKRAVS